MPPPQGGGLGVPPPAAQPDPWDQMIQGIRDNMPWILLLAGVAEGAQDRAPGEDRFPSRDASGRIHGDIPDQVPRDWRSGEIQDAISEVEGSLAQRRGNQQIFGPDRGHDVRIVQEENWLKQLQRRLEDLR